MKARNGSHVTFVETLRAVENLSGPRLIVHKGILVGTDILIESPSNSGGSFCVASASSHTEGTRWCFGWRGAAVKALLAANALS